MKEEKPHQGAHRKTVTSEKQIKIKKAGTKRGFTLKDTGRRHITDFSRETLDNRRQQDNPLKVLQDTASLEFYAQWELS